MPPAGTAAAVLLVAAQAKQAFKPAFCRRGQASLETLLGQAGVDLRQGRVDVYGPGEIGYLQILAHCQDVFMDQFARLGSGDSRAQDTAVIAMAQRAIFDKCSP